MADLQDINYSREATISCIRDYYQFLTQMYLPESAILEPPALGWSNITKESWQAFGKTDEVIELLRHLPYIHEPSDNGQHMQSAAHCHFSDYRSPGWATYLGQNKGQDIKTMTEGRYSDEVPDHVIGLTVGGRDNVVFLLDTHAGIVHWVDCPDRMRPSREPVDEDNFPDDDWRFWSPAWAVAEFFEVLKDQFRDLNFVPLNEQNVTDTYTIFAEEEQGVISLVQDVYREHGWPNLDAYRKEECMRAVRKALKQHYPRFTD